MCMYLLKLFKMCKIILQLLFLSNLQQNLLMTHSIHKLPQLVTHNPPHALLFILPHHFFYYKEICTRLQSCCRRTPSGPCHSSSLNKSRRSKTNTNFESAQTYSHLPLRGTHSPLMTNSSSSCVQIELELVIN